MAGFVGGQENELLEVIKAVWGPKIKDEFFHRWAQGFYFALDEPTALVQFSGGPCAVIAPVQAFILKTVIKGPHSRNWRQVDAKTQYQLLVGAVCDILAQAAQHNGGKFVVVETYESPSSTPGQSEKSSLVEDPDADETMLHVNCPNHFHQHLRIKNFGSREEVATYYLEKKGALHGKYAVLLFLYSLMMTKGIGQILSEVNNPSEPLIDTLFGYGTQSLINLMITGRAVGNVWDHEQNNSGLLGIDTQSEIGYLAYIEHMKGLEVGSLLKNPKNPVWVLDSETHLTVLFSLDNRLVSLETPSEVARRVFGKYDPDGNNFILTTKLGDLMKALGCQHDPPYVKSVMRKLDPENLGIILLTSFLQEFYPDDTKSKPDTFILFHYNGLPGSNPCGAVKYQKGEAILLEYGIKTPFESNPILTCLKTKWLNIQIHWPDDKTPSLT